MKEFFLPGTPLYKKILAFIILAPFVAGIGASFIDFLPSAETDRWGKLISAGLSVLFTIWICFSLKYIKRDYSYYYPKRKIALFLYLFATPFMLFMMFYASFAYSFPRICHIFTSHDAEIVVSLSEKGFGRLSGRYFEFKEFDFLWYKQLYSIRKNLWVETTTGKKLLLTGSQSRFGFVVHSIEKHSLINKGDNTHRLSNRVGRLVGKWFTIFGSIAFVIAFIWTERCISRRASDPRR